MIKVQLYIWVAALLAAVSLPGLCAVQQFQITQQAATDLIRISAAKPGRHKLEIDDAPEFRREVFSGMVDGTLQLHANDAGLIPGINYHVRLDGAPASQDFRLTFSTFANPEVNCKILRHTWEETGRLMTGVAFSGVRWDETTKRWVVVPHNYLNGQSIYSAELYLRPALEAARFCEDLQTLDEIAQYYMLMLQQTESLSTLLSRPNVLPLTKLRMAVADPSARTFAAPFGDKAGDAELYNVQWMHPAAKLVRLVTLIPPDQQTKTMKNFAREYTKFIVVDQLQRYLVQQRLPALGGVSPVGRIELWKLAIRGLKGNDPWDTAMSDIDLWILASAAEILGANANDPQLAPLNPDQLAMLHVALETGVSFFQSKKTLYPETKNFRGERVGSASYFNGDYTAHPDYAYSAVTTEKFPLPSQQRVLAGASWDISHAYRLPIFLRSLYENRKATGLAFPQYHDLELVVNQYVYRVFNGDFSHPLFRNYFDGSDGWHRVGFNGAEFGYPPSAYCDMHNPNRLCLIPGSIIGWGELAFVNSDLVRLEEALVKLAFDPRPDTQEFRDHHYFYSTPYEVIRSGGQPIYGNALYFVIAENAAMIATAGTNGGDRASAR